MKSKSMVAAAILVYLLSAVVVAALVAESDEGTLTTTDDVGPSPNNKKLGIVQYLWGQFQQIALAKNTKPSTNDAPPPKNNQSVDEEDLADDTCSSNSDDATNDDDELVAQLLDWLVNNGAYINPKITVRHLIPNDPTSVRGIFATDNIDIGETVYRIPWKLILKPRNSDNKLPIDEDCGTFEAVANAMRNGGKTSYGKYLLNQPKDYTAAFWSKTGRDLLNEMLQSTRSNHLTELDQLPPRGVDLILKEDIIERCKDLPMNEPLYRHAAMLVKARADYIWMIPLYDMTNHHNGKHNIVHKYYPYNSKDLSIIKQTGYEIIASKSINRNDQLYLTYNRCKYSQHVLDWHGTPEMFLGYGFVESMPQRWLIDFARVKFDLDWKDGSETSGDIVVKFLVHPSIQGMTLLKEELTRLALFAEKHRNMSNDDLGIPSSEWSPLWQYYDALYNALSLAIQESKHYVENDDVWDLDDNWWVQDGDTYADDESHEVYPTINDPFLGYDPTAPIRTHIIKP